MAPFLMVAGWGVLLCALLWWWLAGAEEPAPAAPAADPYADEVARFRRELHDWDRP